MADECMALRSSNLGVILPNWFGKVLRSTVQLFYVALGDGY